jgi:hypothetical protein
MYNKSRKVIYIKPSFQGIGSIPVGATGNVLIYAQHPLTTKLLIDFYNYGKAIVPLSSIKIAGE